MSKEKFSGPECTAGLPVEREAAAARSRRRALCRRSAARVNEAPRLPQPCSFEVLLRIRVLYGHSMTIAFVAANHDSSPLDEIAALCSAPMSTSYARFSATACSHGRAGY
jgi:hypothetical protein